MSKPSHLAAVKTCQQIVLNDNELSQGYRQRAQAKKTVNIRGTMSTVAIDLTVFSSAVFI